MSLRTSALRARLKALRRLEEGKRCSQKITYVFDLILLGGLLVPLLGDGGIGLGVDLGFFKWFRHVGSCSEDC